MKKISELIKKEIKRQNKVTNLIPSENVASKQVMEAVGSPLMNKYSEGYPGGKYYQGNQVVDEIENTVRELTLKAFKLSPARWSANVQPLSGAVANIAAYFGTLRLNDRIVAMSLAHGGHLTHGHDVSLTSKLFNFEHYGVSKDGFLDYGEIESVVRRHKPQLVVCGGSAYPRAIDFKKFRKIADSVGALLMADIAHIAGLVIGGVHKSPFPNADVVTTTTHKTLRGPRGALIISRKELIGNIDKALFPGLQGGPFVNSIAGIGVALEEAVRPAFKKYSSQIVLNAKALASAVIKLGVNVVSGGTDNHLLLIDVTPLGLTGARAAVALEKVGIIVNKNMIPFDTRKPWDPSGIRLGTPAVTSAGMKERDMIYLAEKIVTTLKRAGSKKS